MTPKSIWNLPMVEFTAFPEIHEKRRLLLVTSAPAWEAVKGRLPGLTPVVSVCVQEATLIHWQALSAQAAASGAEVVYAVGGGLAADAGKYLACQLDLPLTVCPTALSVDAFLTAASGIRRDGCVFYIETKPPEHLLLDLEIIAAAPGSMRAAGITDVVSIATGSWDWKFAHEQGKNPPGMEFIPWVHDNAQSILNGALDCAAAAGRGDREGLKTLYDCLVMEVQLCNQIGHARPEEGSEHYFAYCAEQFTGPGWPHGDLVGPGILLMASRQGQETRSLEDALQACQIPLDRIPAGVAERTMQELPAYCQKHALPFGIAHLPVSK